MSHHLSSSGPASAAEVLGPQLTKLLSEKLYDKRKTAALEIERLVREALVVGNSARVDRIIRAVVSDFAYSTLANARNGGLIALAAVAIALGSEQLSPRLDSVVPPILSCFSDPDTRVRYYACESMYNVAKVARKDVLRFFNEIFDALSRLVADVDASVKNGAELLDKLIKDIVCEHAAYYSQQQQLEALRRMSSSVTDDVSSILSNELVTVHPPPSEPAFPATPGSTPLLPNMIPTTFNFPRFIPLLAERIKTLNPFTRMYLIQWITTLDTIPYLELVGYLPDFLDGLFGYLSDSNLDVRTAALNLLSEFLKEIGDVVRVQREMNGGILVNVVGKRRAVSVHANSTAGNTVVELGSGVRRARSGSNTSSVVGNAARKGEYQAGATDEDTMSLRGLELYDGPNSHASHPRHPGQLDVEDDPLKRPSSTLSLASSFYAEAGKVTKPSPIGAGGAVLTAGAGSSVSILHDTQGSASYSAYREGLNVRLDIGRMVGILVPRLSSADEETQATALRWIYEFVGLVQGVMIPFVAELVGAILPCLSHQVNPIRNVAAEANAALFRLVKEFEEDGTLTGNSLGVEGGYADDIEMFDARGVVEALRAQFLEESEEARVASMEWMAMLHKKTPKKVIDSEDGTFQALLKLLSDTSEEVVKKDLQLLAQISISSDDEYFTRFLINLLDLFCLDKRLLESRGSLIIRHLCLSLNPERMFKVFAEILEKDEDLEFASLMVQNLNIILATAPELSDLRRRLRNLDSRDGMFLFVGLYRSWCHNPVATFCLCLLSQAYEHASNLLQVFAELEITVQFLIQVDKLVQLIESPVFTYLRLQLLEPDRYPHLYKCLFGILMLLPQSSAFATLRNRLNSVGSMVMLHGIGPGPFGMVGAPSGGVASMTPPSGNPKRTKPQATEPLGVKWSDLLVHFRNVQFRHERSRRAGGRSNSANPTKRRTNTTSSIGASANVRLSRSVSLAASVSNGGASVTVAGNDDAALDGQAVPLNSLVGESPNLSSASLEATFYTQGGSGVVSGGTLSSSLTEASSSNLVGNTGMRRMPGGFDNIGGNVSSSSGGSASAIGAANVVKTKKPWSLGGSKR
ncbi:vacuolar protein 14 C-terminal Fig4p binding-domain-containing protein [Chytriomyces sp. MP71]|nr:vacuolar protein 14 C-terminal Fig4p binding-domain-containing protein [Chytriomyces sp. MP71]